MFNDGPKWKKRKIDHMQYNFSEMSVDEPGFNGNLEVFCSSQKRHELIEHTMKRNNNAQINIQEKYEDNIVYCSGRYWDIFRIKDTLQKIGFKYKDSEWTMNRTHFVDDYELFIANLLDKAVKNIIYHYMYSILKIKTKEKESYVALSILVYHTINIEMKFIFQPITMKRI